MKRISCLIFDDELCSLEILQNYVNQISILQIEGYFINPLEGLAIAKKSPPDLIISDLNMPQLSGVQLHSRQAKSLLCLLGYTYTVCDLFFSFLS